MAAAADVAPGAIVRVADTPLGPVALVNVNGAFHAARDRCPHAAAALSEGFLEGEWLVCPTHFAEFHVRTGEVRNAPKHCPNVAIHEIVQQDGDLHLVLAAPLP